MNEEQISTPNSDEKIKITADSNFKFSRFSLLSKRSFDDDDETPSRAAVRRAETAE